MTTRSHRHFRAIHAAALGLYAGAATGSVTGLRPEPLTDVPSVSFSSTAPVASIGEAPVASPRWYAGTADPETGVSRSVAPRSARRFGRTPEEAARRFVRENAASLGTSGSDSLHYRAGASGAMARQAILQQTSNGVPVRGRFLAVNVTPDGRVLSLENHLRAARTVDARPRVGATQAAQALRGRLLTAPTLLVDDDGPTPRLVWEFRKSREPVGAVTVSVDAHTGVVVSADGVSNAIFGVGRIFDGNPVVTPTPVVRRLDYLDGSGWLTGTYAKVYRFRNYEEPILEGTQETFDPRSVFLYVEDDVRLSQVQVYYGICRARDFYAKTLGFRGRDHQLPAFTHWYGLENAYYIPDHPPHGAMAFGYENGVDFALDSDVLYHEYLHAVTDVVNRDWTRAGERAIEATGISEGTADYFSCSMEDDPVLGEYAGSALGRPYVRRLDNANRFPEDMQLPVPLGDGRVAQTYPQIHHVGEIWGGACWDLRMQIGAAADRLLFAAVGLFTPGTRLQDGLVHLLAVDAELFAGKHAKVIRGVFAARGILGSAYPIRTHSADAFAGTDGLGPRTGFVRPGPGGTFVEAYDYAALGLFPSFAAGRLYAMPGYVRDGRTRSVFMVLRDARNRVAAYAGTDTWPMLSLSSDGSVSTMGAYNLGFRAPALRTSDPRGVAGLRLYLHTYAESAASVAARFSAARPLAVSAGQRAQIIRDTAGGLVPEW